MTVKAVVVSAEGEIEVRDIGTDLNSIKAVVGGWLEAIHPSSDEFGNWHAYVDEEGKLKGLPVNIKATMFAIQIGWQGRDVLCGPVVFLGQGGQGEDYGAEEADVPEQVEQWAMSLTE